MENFTEFHYILGCTLLGYGIVVGFNNTILRVKTFLTRKRFIQNDTGMYLDAVFYAGVFYLWLVFSGVVVLWERETKRLY